MELLSDKSAGLSKRVETGFRRYLYDHINWNNRLTGIIGARGTGKTTLLLQKLHELDSPQNEAAYFSLDDLYFLGNPLVETATEFYKKGGKHLFLDEVNKYPDWAGQIEKLYDLYPDLQIVFAGSSIIDQVDLGRHAVMYELQGLSYREYLQYLRVPTIDALSLEEILEKDSPWKKKFSPEFRPLQYFDNYLAKGYYPFFKEACLFFI